MSNGHKHHFLFLGHLVGGFNPSENMKVNWDDYSQQMEKYKMFQTTNQYSDRHGPWLSHCSARSLGSLVFQHVARDHASEVLEVPCGRCHHFPYHVVPPPSYQLVYHPHELHISIDITYIKPSYTTFESTWKTMGHRFVCKLALFWYIPLTHPVGDWKEMTQMLDDRSHRHSVVFLDVM